jgi:hypothetical protein
MKINTTFNYREIIKRIGVFLAKNKIIVTSLVILAVGLFVLHRISILTHPEVDQKHLNEELSKLQGVSFDEEAIKKIDELENSSINIKSDFSDRDNPFADN